MKKLIITFVAVTGLAIFLVQAISKQEKAEIDHAVQCGEASPEQAAILGCK